MRWRVGFVASIPGDRSWFHPFLRRWVHVWAARRVAIGLWWWVEWSHTELVLGLVSSASVRQASLRAGLVVSWPGGVAQPRWKLPQFGTHCASVAAHAVRVRVPFATPWRLSCALQRDGGVPLLRREMEG